MERVFIKDIKDAEGEVRFSAGQLKEYPKATWKQLCTNLGLDLDDFTTTKEAAAKAGIIASQTSEASTEKPERIVRRRTNI